MSRPAERSSDREQLGQVGMFSRAEPLTRRVRRPVPISAEQQASFDRTVEVALEIRPEWVPPGQKLCPGSCGRAIWNERRSCGRRWCDAVRPTWGRSVGEVVRAALSAYVELHGGGGRVLMTDLTCTHKPGWWDTDRCGHPADGSKCSGPAGCRVDLEIELEERRLWPARKRAAMNMARTEALRKLERAGYQIDRETKKTLRVLIAVTEDQKRGLPHEHIVVGHTTALEIAFAKAFFDALPRAARHHGLGFGDRYRYAVAKQGKYAAERFHGYLAKLARYLAKESSGSEFLLKHHGERVFYVAPWLSRLSGMNMTVARLCRVVWAARHGYCDWPRIPDRYADAVERLMGPLNIAPHAP